ncbi:MAG: quinoprotein dehydrogenase-associated putative ABC transporter substrate-binding protein [Steroidobacteraceae bacterium]
MPPRPKRFLPRLAWQMFVLGLCTFLPVAHGTPPSLRVCADPNNLPFSDRLERGFENRLARLLASELGARLEYEWWPQRRGFIRNTLKAGKCDVVMGLPADYELTDLTRPYYTSSYVFVTRRGDGLADLTSLDDPRLRRLRIGLHVIGDDYASVPPATALAARGIVGNVVGYSIYGDYSRPSPPSALVEAVASGAVDVAVAWGPLAGYYAANAAVPLVVRFIEPEPPGERAAPLRFAIAVGVRHGDAALRPRLQQALDRRQAEVRALLAEYHVPLVTAASGGTAAPAAVRGERVFVTNERSGELSVLDTASHRVVATVPLGKRPRGLVVSRDGRRLYIALSGSPIAGPGIDESRLPPADKRADGIGVVDVATLRLLTTLRGVSDPEQLAVSHDGRRLYVASEDTGTAVVLDAGTGRLLSALTVGQEPEGVAISPDGRWVYVSSEAEDEIAVIDTRDDRLVAQVPTCARPRAILFARHSPRAYVSCENSAELALFDTRRHREQKRIAVPGLGARPMGLALSPDEQNLYVATGRGGTVVAFDTRRHRPHATVEVGRRPWGISLSADGSRLYTANGPSNDVTVVDARSMRVIERVNVSGGPWAALVHDPDRVAEPAQAVTDPGSQEPAGSATIR